MTKSELITHLSDKFSQLVHKDAELSVKTIIDSLGNTLSKGGRVEIRGFGSFSLNHRPARLGRNPKTGEKVSVPEKFPVPSTTNASFMLIAVESELSSVVPFTLIAPNSTSPVPLGCMLMSAFEPFELITFVVKLFAVISVAVTLPLNIALPPSLMSNCNAVIVAEESNPLNSMSLLSPIDLITKSEVTLLILPNSVPPSCSFTSALSASSMISPTASIVKWFDVLIVFDICSIYVVKGGV